MINPLSDGLNTVTPESKSLSSKCGMSDIKKNIYDTVQVAQSAADEPIMNIVYTKQ